MKNILLKIEYQGTHYKGWQVQPEAVTIEKTIKTVLQQICRCEITLNASSRTDSGVHSKGQAANVAVPESIDLNKLYHSANSLLPKDISITEMVNVPHDFNARYQNTGKRYIYQIVNSPAPKAIGNELFLWIKNPLNRTRMKNAGRLFLGKHDFSAFRGKGCQQKNTLKTIHRFDCEWNDDGIFTYLRFIIEGSGFLKNMIRVMIGTLIGIGREKHDPAIINKALRSGNRRDAGVTAPAHGLILDEVFFSPDPFLSGKSVIRSPFNPISPK